MASNLSPCWNRTLKEHRMFRKSSPGHRLAALISLVFLIVGCSVKSCSSRANIPPEEQLHKYIDTAVNITSYEEKEELISLTAGELRRAISAAKKEAFMAAYVQKKYDFRAFEVVERRDVEPDKVVELDFRLNYKSWNSGEEPDLVPYVETLNRATMIYQYGQWSLANVESLESSFDWEVGLSLDNVDTTGVSPDDEPVEIISPRSIEGSSNPEIDGESEID